MYSDIFQSFELPDDASFNQNTCEELRDIVSNEEAGKQRFSTCQYVKYTKEGEEKAKEAKISLKLYSYEDELLLEYEGKYFGDFKFVEDN